MATTIHVTADPVWSDPSIEGLEVTDAEWLLNVDRDHDLIRGPAGIEPANGMCDSQIRHNVVTHLYREGR